MESQPQTPEFRINPENFHPCFYCLLTLMTSFKNSDVHSQVRLLVFQSFSIFFAKSGVVLAGVCPMYAYFQEKFLHH